MAVKLKKKTWINVIGSISIIVELIAGFVINKMSSDGFDFWSRHNIALYVVLVITVIIMMFCKFHENNVSKRAKQQKLQKAFQDNGGYEAVVDEMKNCISRHDFRTIRELKKIVDYVEK